MDHLEYQTHQIEQSENNIFLDTLSRNDVRWRNNEFFLSDLAFMINVWDLDFLPIKYSLPTTSVTLSLAASKHAT